MTPPDSASSRHPSGKATLFCFDCGHESPIEGDWTVRFDGDRDVYTCPECHTTIAARPRSRPLASDGEAGRCYCPGD